MIKRLIVAIIVSFLLLLSFNILERVFFLGKDGVNQEVITERLNNLDNEISSDIKRNFLAEKILPISNYFKGRIKNNVFKGSDGYLFNHVNYKMFEFSVEERLPSNYIEQINYYYLEIPPKEVIYSENLPYFFPNINQQYLESKYKRKSECLDKDIYFIDMYEKFMEHKNDYLYYKTDSRFTPYGSYLTFTSLIESINTKEGSSFLVPNWSNLEPVVKPLEFLGNQSVAIGDTNNLNTDFSDFRFFYNKSEITRYDNGEISELPLVNVREDISLFGDFLTGDFANVVLKKNEPYNKALIIGNSFANPLLVYLSHYYDEVHLIQPELYQGDIETYINENSLETVIIAFDSLILGDSYAN